MTALFFHVIERNVLAYRRLWGIFLTGFAEPLLYLASIGIGVGALVGTVKGPGGQMVPYDQFVAPGLLAAAAMNGSVFDTTFNFFFKYKYAKTFDAMLSTPLGPRDVARGELGWALMRGSIYAAAFLFFMAILGLTSSWWAILCLPAAMLIGFAFAGAGMACTTFMRSFVDFDYVNMVLLPLFLFSGTFFPLSQYPTAVQWIVRCTPLYQGVALERSLAFGDFNWAIPFHILYLALMGSIGLRIASRRLALLLQP
jgi:lipooligosaccharide transport system permease protein